MSELPAGAIEVFLSTPSARRATARAEAKAAEIIFLSTPSARRATRKIYVFTDFFAISIHALREEGDRLTRRFEHHKIISIHALREEGDFPTFPRIPVL